MHKRKLSPKQDIDAEILREALPYIRRFKGKTFVVKISGKVTEDPGNLNSLAVVGDTYSGVFALNTLQVLGKAKVYCNEQFNIASELLLDNATLVTNEAYAGKITIRNGGVLSQPQAP